MIVAVDFDGTVVKHEYPGIGEPVPGAIDVLREIQRAKHKIILLTMRDGDQLKEAVAYLQIRGVHPWAVNHNPKQADWTSSPKVYAHVYIDDAALGCPLFRPNLEERAYVDWIAVREWLATRELI